MKQPFRSYQGQNQQRVQSGYIDVSDFEGKDPHSPKKRLQSDQYYRSEADNHAHTFQKNRLHSERSGRERIASKQLPNKYMEIKPYIDDILSDQITENKEVQRGLQQLKYLNEKLLSDLGNSGYQRQEAYAKGSYWDQIQRVIHQIISNAQNQSMEFKASLQHLNNIKSKALHQDLEYQYDQPNNVARVQTRKYPNRSRNNSRNAPPGTFSDYLGGGSDNEQRLHNEIMMLKDQREDLGSRLNQQIEKNRLLTKRLRELQRNEHSYVQERSRGGQVGSFDEHEGQDMRMHLNRLGSKLRQTQNQNNSLRRELQGMRHHGEGHPQSARQDLRNHARELEGYVHASQTRANNYQGSRHAQQRLIDELRKLKSENERLRRDTTQLLSKSKPSLRQFDDSRYNHVERSLAQPRDQKVRDQGRYRGDLAQNYYRDY